MVSCAYAVFLRVRWCLPSYCRLTNDGNAILREIDVAHPAAKNMIELSRTQDEECGDGVMRPAEDRSANSPGSLSCNLQLGEKTAEREVCLTQPVLRLYLSLLPVP